MAGVDTQSVANSLGEESFWGTVQSSTITMSGTWGASVTLLEQITNDVQLVDLTGNPYQFNQGVYVSKNPKEQEMAESKVSYKVSF